MCVSHQITTESEERGGDKATRADGDWKEHASVLFCDIRGYTLRESVLKMRGLILSKGGLMQVQSDATLMIADKRSTRVFHIVLGLFFLYPIKILYDAKMHSVNLSERVQLEKNVFKPTPYMQTASYDNCQHNGVLQRAF